MATNKKRPLIGISCSYDGTYERGKLKVSGEYLGAVWANGGIPVLLKWQNPDTEDGLRAIKEYAQTFDGFIFSGGIDVHPKYYGEQISHPSVSISDERDSFELALFSEIYENTKKPLLGICRGEQLINVALGGTLHQHIEGHSQSEPSDVLCHSVSILPFTVMHTLTGKKDMIRTNTFHHQAVKDLALTLRPSGISEDGIIEAYESADMDSRFILAVQWHPELFYGKDESAASIFCEFVKRCEGSEN